MNTKLFFIVFFFCLVLFARAADEKENTTNTDVSDNSNKNTETSNNSDNKTTDAKTDASTDTNTDADGKTDAKTNTNTNDKTTNNSNDANNKSTDNTKDNNNDTTNDNFDLGDGHIDTITNTNTTLDACGTTSSQLGMFSFSKPISKSVLAPFTNFTIIWYYNNIIYDSYSYPTNNITLSLFYEEDANSNNWASSWKTPVWEKTLPMSEIQEGPTLTNNVRSYQWDWKIRYDENGANNEGFVQSLKTNEKYKLRISGDGKDIQRNENLKCYQDGDIMPGTTRAFYIVENNHIPSYEQMKIADGAFAISSIKIISQIILPIAFSFFYLFMN
eukprot:jgi/Orpsp1_1/1176366/evm.model.c7180000057323.1